MSRAVLALFAKAPVAGEVKTRLCPPLRPEQAAAFYEAMLRDVLERPAPGPGIERALWFTPAGAREWFAAAAPGYRLYVQRGATLPERMCALFHEHAAEGCRRIVLRGTDSPTLPDATVALAFAALERVPLVLCPDEDGGYNLIGLREPADELFDLELSTASVLEKTLERAAALGLAAECLPAHHDVDTFEDLARLRPDERTPRTARWLAELRGSMTP